MIQALSGVVNNVLGFFYSLVHNYGIAIIMLTVLINIIMFPLTRKQLQSSKKMQDIQPELNRIKEKYKNDKEKLNQATMEYMSKNKVNPLGGCLPLIIQFPIMIAVFQLLRNQELISQSIPNFNPGFLCWNLTMNASEIYKIFADPLLGQAYSPQIYVSSFLIVILYYALPVLAAGTTFLQQRLMITDPSQKMMMYIAPVMILVISLSLPTGLILYWFTNSLFSVGNSLLIKNDVNIFAAKNKSADSLENTEESRPLKEQKAEKMAAEKLTSGKESAVEKSGSQAAAKAKKQKISNKGPKKKNVKGKKKGAGNSK